MTLVDTRKAGHPLSPFYMWILIRDEGERTRTKTKVLVSIFRHRRYCLCRCHTASSICNGWCPRVPVRAKEKDDCCRKKSERKWGACLSLFYSSSVWDEEEWSLLPSSNLDYLDSTRTTTDSHLLLSSQLVVTMCLESWIPFLQVSFVFVPFDKFVFLCHPKNCARSFFLMIQHFLDKMSSKWITIKLEWSLFRILTALYVFVEVKATTASFIENKS